MTKIYKFKVYDINSDGYKSVNSYASEDYIRKIEGSRVILETVIEVGAECLDAEGRLISMDLIKSNI